MKSSKSAGYVGNRSRTNKINLKMALDSVFGSIDQATLTEQAQVREPNSSGVFGQKKVEIVISSTMFFLY